jgi:hypothetical protein
MNSCSETTAPSVVFTTQLPKARSIGEGVIQISR